MKILLADHHPVFRRGLKAMMERDPKFTFKGKVESGTDLIAAIEKFTPDLLILEIDLPNANGVAILREVKLHAPHVKVLVLSSHPEEIYALSAIKAGAHGYVTKMQPIATVKKALITIGNGGTYLSEAIQENANSKHSMVLRFKKLSTREIEVLNLLSRGKRNKEISHNLNINEKTVSTYKTRLLKKLKVDNVADLIHQSRLLQLTQ
jgi:DNA-binding NarL/FixJ family response regulator